jgi:hypothetical protein
LGIFSTIKVIYKHGKKCVGLNSGRFFSQTRLVTLFPTYIRTLVLSLFSLIYSSTCPISFFSMYRRSFVFIVYHRTEFPQRFLDTYPLCTFLCTHTAALSSGIVSDCGLWVVRSNPAGGSFFKEKIEDISSRACHRHQELDGLCSQF